MSRTCALALFLAAYSCDAADTDQYAAGPVAPAPTPSLLGPRAYKVPHTISTTPPPYGHGVSQTPWWDNKVVKKGLIGGAAAAGLATFGGLGIAAIVQANQKTTTPYVPPPTLPPAPPTTVNYAILNRAVAQKQADEETSSMSPVLAGILILFGLLCCCGIIAFCAYMVSKKTKRNTKRTIPKPQEDEEAPFLPQDTQQQFPMPPAYEPASMYAPAPSYQMPAPSYQLAPTVASAMVAPPVYDVPATTVYEYAAPAPVTTLAPSTTMAFAAPSYVAPSYAAPSYAAPAYAAPALSMMMAPTTMAPSTQFPVTTYQKR
mmetsp:Transcript_35519/g.55188  ORF Transcript_35519/g.55188 Transcript_35519/m.55188 type:complete len:317 (+) Transcript_35519:45-995(+)|eukprot:CAMPEP_0169154216 /NCGR_PEP_ID=MMETSP1015-20121227/52578_1 /TAXON_ID=342587 /ORGANISM="Karlodinium micrum, Strain CCMP2283" /LENGTH=316 /DNA_ID=CAMNT_0009224361 /DNA_START=48 /DNA_END=998 /DNA_ORIENTATION=+